jgi:hypothetical protein
VAGGRPGELRVSAVDGADVRSFTSAVLATAVPRVAWWPLTETSGTVAADRQGAGALTYTNAPSLNQAAVVPSELEGSAAFNGTTQYAISATSVAAFNLAAPFTVIAWVYPTGLPATGQFGRIVGKGPTSWRMTVTSASQFEFRITPGDGSATAIATSAAITLNQPYMVAATFDQANLGLSVNAGTEVTTAMTVNPATSTNAVAVASTDGTGSYLAGRVQHVILFGGIVDAAARTALYAAGTDATANTVPPPNAAAILNTTVLSSSATIDFDPSVDDGGARITQYRVRVVKRT